ncbi:hypothetical protein ABK040_005413 [Willaertia magna]
MSQKNNIIPSSEVVVEMVSYKDDNLTIKHVCQIPEINSVELISVFVLQIENNKLISKTIEYLNKNIPLNEYNFIKRIKKINNENYILIDINLNNLNEIYNTHLNLFKNLLGYSSIEDLNKFIHIMNIPKYIPKLKKDWLDWNNNIWPLKQMVLPNSLLQLIKNDLQIESSINNHSINNILKYAKLLLNNNNKICSCFVNSFTNEVIGDIIEDESMNSNYSPYHSKCLNIDNKYKLKHCTLLAIANVSKISNYLCKDLDFIITHEPCIMCAMALLHSRIRRVYFVYPLERNGGFTCHYIHEQQKLNHHFNVYQINLQNL